ncbi:MAG: DUF2207 domain-containing protein [Candidatus Acidiferrales bacterium]
MRFSPGVTEILILLFFAIPILFAVRMFWLCWTRGREPEQGSITVQYDPPDNLTPGECAALVENKIAMSTITATIVDLSVKGYLAIKQEQVSSQAAAANAGKSFVFHLLREQDDWNTLKPHEKAVLTGIFVRMNPLEILSEAMSKLQNAAPDSPVAPMYARVQDRIAATESMIAANPGLSAVTDRQFGPKNEVALLELHNQFYMHLQRIRDAVFDSIVASGYYDKRPDRVRLAYGVSGVATGLLMAAGGVVLAAATRTPPWPWVLAGILTGTIILVAGRMMTPRTVAGTQALARVMGFRDFIARVDKDQIARVEKTPDLFEKYLPYAMALRVETKWSQAFGNLSMPAPRWYGSNLPGDFQTAHLVDDLTGMSTQAETVLTSRSAATR